MIKPCKNGHPVNNNRKDGRCSYCNTERNRRYRQTPKGKATDSRYEAKRTQIREPKPERWYFKLKYNLLQRINYKRNRIKELEGANA